MMNYWKRRFSAGDLQNDIADYQVVQRTLVDSHMNITSDQSILPSQSIEQVDPSIHSNRSSLDPNSISNIRTNAVNRQTSTEFLPSSIVTKAKSKLLLVIDSDEVDWSKCFQNRKIFADFDIHVEQAQFQDINLSAHACGGVLIHVNVYRNGKRSIRSFYPDFVLVRQYVTDVNTDWTNIILGMQYGAVPSVNSIRALYNFRDKPWVFAELLKIQRRLGAEQFPLISQVYFPNYRKMFISPQCPSVIKVGQAHLGLGKIKVSNPYDYQELRGIVSMSQSYSTIEPYVRGKCDIFIQKIGHHYKAFSRQSISGNWKVNMGSSIITQIEMTDRYRLWIDEVSQLFGGLDICAIKVVQAMNDKEYIIEANDCTMPLLNETKDDDCQLIAELVTHKMQIYCRPDHQRSILQRITSLDELPNFAQNDMYETGNVKNTLKTSNKNHTRQTLADLKRAFVRIFNDIIS